MDVQNSLNAFTRLNDLARRPESSAGLNWTDALDAAQATPATIAAPQQNQPSNSAFANLLDKAIEAKPDSATTAQAKSPEEAEKEKQLRKWATTLVNKFFVGTMLKQMLESPFKTEVFGVGKSGEAFQGMMDQHIAEHSGNRLAKSLVDSIVKSKMKHEADPHQLYTDQKQQKQFEKYLEQNKKRVKHDAATSFTA